MDTLGERVASERAAKGWTQAELAERVTRSGFRIGQAGIAQIERRGETEPKCIVQLAAALGVSLGWLQTGRGERYSFIGGGFAEPAVPAPQMPIQTVSAIPADGRRPDVPVWASAQAGDDGAMVLSDDPIDMIRRSERLAGVKNPFAFYVIGGSMSPAIEHGDQVVVNPSLPVRTGKDCVFIQDRPDGSMLALVKRMLRAGGDSWRVRQFEPARDFDLSRKKWSRAYVIAEIRRGGL